MLQKTDEGGFSNLAAMQDLIRENFGDGVIGQFDRVRMPAAGGLVFQVPDPEGDKGAESLVGVILHHHAARGLWTQEFTGGTPPECSSTDGVTGVGDPGGVCERCPLNAWGSDEKGGKGKQCKEMRRVYLLRPGEQLPLVLTLPPTSLQSIRDYAMRLTRSALSIRRVITEIRLVAAKSEKGILFARSVFQMKEQLREPTANAVTAYASALMPYLQRAPVDSGELVGALGHVGERGASEEARIVLRGEPEMRYTAMGTAVTHVMAETPEGYRQVTAWGELAERLNQEGEEDSTLVVTGFYGERTWEDRGGEARSELTLTIQSFEVLPAQSEVSSSEVSTPADIHPQAYRSKFEGVTPELDLPF